jgi:ComF family protein
MSALDHRPARPRSAVDDSIWKEAGRAALNVLYPPKCAGCGTSHPESSVPHLCTPCLERLPRLTAPYCRVCGEWFVGQISGEFRCGNCQDRRFDFEFAYAPLRAEESARELVHRLKYDRILWLRRPLGHLMSDALRGDFAEPRLSAEARWILVPVPLHPRRLRERQFNQAAELCRVIRRLTSLPVRDVLRRTRYTTVQARLPRRERLENLRGAFDLTRREKHFPTVRGQPVLLVDDVFTTGATTQECARLLRREGHVGRVAVLTAVRG